MRLTVLGCNGPFPAAGGATSGYLVTEGETRVALDLGTGTLAALTALTPPEELSALLLTHWHSDHCSDTLPLLYRLQATGRRLTVYAPEDLTSPVRQALAADASIDMNTVRPGDTLTIGALTVKAFAARHPVPALMLRLTNGRQTLAYTGDTNTVSHLREFAQGASLLLADGLFTGELWSEQKPHLSAAHCAALARDAGVSRLVITHLNPFIDPETLLREARAIFPAAELAERGRAYTL